VTKSLLKVQTPSTIVEHMLHDSDSTHEWPHTSTMRLSSVEIRSIQNWMSVHECRAYYVDVTRRAYTTTTGKYAVRVYCRDLEVWPMFVLAWAK
jgi:hypothetical protein